MLHHHISPGEIVSLANEACNGLIEFYPALDGREARAAAIDRASRTVTLTGYRQGDYERVRDEVEKLAKELSEGGVGPWCEFHAFQLRNADAIQALLTGAHLLTVRQAHLQLVDELKGAIGAEAANGSSDDPADQEDCLGDAEAWVAENVSSGGDLATVAVAAFLYGFPEAQAILRSGPAAPSPAEPGTTKLIEVRLSALVRREFLEIVEVPADISDEEVSSLIERRYASVDGGLYADDPDSWNRSDCCATDAPASAAATVQAFRCGGTLQVRGLEPAAQAA